MNAGKLRRRVTLQRKQVIQDSYGAEIATWTEFAAVWGRVAPLSGREFWAAQQAQQGEITTSITIRHRDDVKMEDRVVWGTRVFDIKSVREDERERELELMCREMRE